MTTDKIYFTLLIYVKPGQYETFQAYESKVLPLLPSYNGTLELRLKTDKKADETEVPDEIHILSFRSMQDFDRYRTDDRRKQYLDMFHFAVEKAMLIKGTDIRTPGTNGLFE
jgi:antibiotic biosynthesis monooxygenase (ABM) superfamily enzyme